MANERFSIPVVFMTADSWRHRFVANYLIDHLNVVGVVCEQKRPLPQGETQEQDEVIKKHFIQRDQSEIEFFGAHRDFNIEPDKLLYVAHGESNTQKVFDWVKDKKPKYLVLFGTSIIKDPLLGFYENKVINMHLGLSPYYRGAGTNFWPLVFNEPECVGVTVHLATLKVDAGAILGQARPDIEMGDTNHEIGNKTIVAGAQLLTRCVIDYDKGIMRAQPQTLRGRVFKNEDFKHESVLKMWKNFEEGMIDNYLANKKERVAKYPIVEIG